MQAIDAQERVMRVACVLTVFMQVLDSLFNVRVCQTREELNVSSFDSARRRASRHQSSDHAVRPSREAIASDRKMPKGLRDLAGDDNLIKAMKTTARDLKTLASIDLPAPVSKDGYMQLLVAIRGVAKV